MTNELEKKCGECVYYPCLAYDKCKSPDFISYSPHSTPAILLKRQRDADLAVLEAYQKRINEGGIMPDKETMPLIKGKQWELVNKRAGVDVIGMVMSFKKGRLAADNLVDCIAKRCDITSEVQRDADRKWSDDRLKAKEKEWQHSRNQVVIEMTQMMDKKEKEWEALFVKEQELTTWMAQHVREEEADKEAEWLKQHTAMDLQGHYYITISDYKAHFAELRRIAERK